MTAPIPPDLEQRIEMIAERVARRVVGSSPLRSAVIREGGLTIKDGGRFRAEYPSDLGGGVVAYIGDINSEATGEFQGTGLLLQQPDGTDIAVFRTVEAGGSIVQLRDGAGNTAVSTDDGAGIGLNRPALPAAFYPARVQDFPKVTAGAFDTVWRSYQYKYHAGLMVFAWGATDTAGTTGEVRVMVNGVQLGATQGAVFGVVNGWAFGPSTVPGAIGDLLTVEIQGRRTAGAGSVQVGAGWALGRAV